MQGISIGFEVYTHKPEILKDGDTLLINPGTPSGYINKEKTISIIDLIDLDVKIIKL